MLLQEADGIKQGGFSKCVPTSCLLWHLVELSLQHRLKLARLQKCLRKVQVSALVLWSLQLFTFLNVFGRMS